MATYGTAPTYCPRHIRYQPCCECADEAELRRKLMPPVPPKGCQCPPTSEATCQRSDCGRRDAGAKSSAAEAIAAAGYEARRALLRLGDMFQHRASAAKQNSDADCLAQVNREFHRGRATAFEDAVKLLDAVRAGQAATPEPKPSAWRNLHPHDHEKVLVRVLQKMVGADGMTDRTSAMIGYRAHGAWWASPGMGASPCRIEGVSSEVTGWQPLPSVED